MRRSSALLLLIAGCGGYPPQQEVTFAEGPIRHYVVNKLMVPMQRSDYAIDLNGDARADNQFGNSIGALAAQNLDTQAGVEESVTSGVRPLLLALQALDLDEADHAGLTIQLGLPNATPDFTSGHGQFHADEAAPTAQLFGTLHESKLLTNNPVTTKRPVSLTVPLVLVVGQPPVLIPLEGAHVKLKTGIDSASVKPGLLQGEIHGSISKSHFEAEIAPTLATFFTRIITEGCQQGVCNQQATSIGAFLDVGGCPGAQANDAIVDPCELLVPKNLFLQFFALDVQIHDAQGRYAPNKDNQVKDSMSFGLGFTAVAAEF